MMIPLLLCITLSYIHICVTVILYGAVLMSQIWKNWLYSKNESLELFLGLDQNITQIHYLKNWDLWNLWVWTNIWLVNPCFVATPNKFWLFSRVISNQFNMMTSSNGNIFRVTGHLCGELTGPRWIPRTKASDAELWCFLWSSPE